MEIFPYTETIGMSMLLTIEKPISINAERFI